LVGTIQDLLGFALKLLHVLVELLPLERIILALSSILAVGLGIFVKAASMF